MRPEPLADVAENRRFNDFRSVQEYYRSIQLNNKFLYSQDAESEAILQAVTLPGCELECWTSQGQVVNATSCSPNRITIGVLEAGRAEVEINGMLRRLEVGDAVLYLPGDTTVNTLVDMKGFILRVPVAHSELLRVKALPASRLKTVSRFLNREDAKDFLSLLRFAQTNFAGSSTDDQIAQRTVVGEALVRRVRFCLEQHLSPLLADTPMVEVCLACEAAITAQPDRWFTASEFAAIGICSLRQLYRAFQTVLGVTPVEYLCRAKLLALRALLVAESAPGFKQIAHSLGFATGHRAMRLYAAEFHESPNDTRTRHWRTVSQATASVGLKPYSLPEADLGSAYS